MNIDECFELNDKLLHQIPSTKIYKIISNRYIRYILKYLAMSRIIGFCNQIKSNGYPLSEFHLIKGLLPITYVDTDYFQSERFFNPKKLNFIIKKQHLKKAEKILDSLPSETTKIFVHIRRGDYLFHEYAGIRGINLPREYYENAIQCMCEEINDPYFIFISDDPEYVECCYRDIENKYISNNSMYVDVALMTLCDCGIVSNSSFSWWGAYLMYSRNKVIFPKYWFGWKSKIESHPGIQPDWAEVMEVE